MPATVDFAIDEWDGSWWGRPYSKIPSQQLSNLGAYATVLSGLHWQMQPYVYEVMAKTQQHTFSSP